MKRAFLLKSLACPILLVVAPAALGSAEKPSLPGNGRTYTATYRPYDLNRDCPRPGEDASRAELDCEHLHDMIEFTGRNMADLPVESGEVRYSKAERVGPRGQFTRFENVCFQAEGEEFCGAIFAANADRVCRVLGQEGFISVERIQGLDREMSPHLYLVDPRLRWRQTYNNWNHRQVDWGQSGLITHLLCSNVAPSRLKERDFLRYLVSDGRGVRRVHEIDGTWWFDEPERVSGLALPEYSGGNALRRTTSFLDQADKLCRLPSGPPADVVFERNRPVWLEREPRKDGITFPLVLDPRWGRRPLFEEFFNRSPFLSWSTATYGAPSYEVTPGVVRNYDGVGCFARRPVWVAGTPAPNAPRIIRLEDVRSPALSVSLGRTARVREDFTRDPINARLIGAKACPAGTAFGTWTSRRPVPGDGDQLLDKFIVEWYEARVRENGHSWVESRRVSEMHDPRVLDTMTCLATSEDWQATVTGTLADAVRANGDGTFSFDGPRNADVPLAPGAAPLYCQAVAHVIGVQRPDSVYDIVLGRSVSRETTVLDQTDVLIQDGLFLFRADRPTVLSQVTCDFTRTFRNQIPRINLPEGAQNEPAR